MNARARRWVLVLAAMATSAGALAGGYAFFPPDLYVVGTRSGNLHQGQTGATLGIVVFNHTTTLPAVILPTSGVVTVVDVLPPALTATAIAGAGWSCTLATLTCTRSDSLSSGASYPPVVVTFDVSPSAPASVTNTFTVSGGGESNTTLGDNTVNDVIDIAAVFADFYIVKSHAGSFSRGQSGATYDIAVANLGSGATSGTVTVVDTLPAGLTATAMAGSGWSCTLATLTCTRSDALPSGGSYPVIVLTVDVWTSAPPSLVNIATVSGGGAIPAARTTSDATTIAAGPESAIPALSDWAMLVLGTLLAFAGARAIRKR